MRIRRAISRGLLLGVLGAVLSLTPTGFEFEEQFGLSSLFRVRGPITPPPDAVIVAIGGDSFQAFQSLSIDRAAWPPNLRECVGDHLSPATLRTIDRVSQLPRQLHACLINELSRSGAEVITFDVMFRRATNEYNDLALARAMSDSGRVVILETIERTNVRSSTDPTSSEALPIDVLTSPFPLIAQAAAKTAPNPIPKNQLRVNQFWLETPSVGNVLTLPVAALRVFNQRRQQAIIRKTESEFRLRGATQYTYFGHYGPPGSVKTFSFFDVLTGAVPARREFAGKAIFVGALDLSNADQPDAYPTVFPGRYGVDTSGVELTATAFLNLLHGQDIIALTNLEKGGVMLSFGLLLGAVATLWPGWRGVLSLAGLCLAYAICTALLFSRVPIWLPLVIPTFVIFPTALLLSLGTEYRSARRWLQRYVPKGVAQQLMRGDESNVTEMHECAATIMFTDIRSFTSLSERHAPELISDMLNVHFSIITRVVEAERGVIDKFIGDSVMAFWGALEHQPDNAIRGCRAALSIAAKIHAENERRRGVGEFTVEMRIGVNSGQVTAGNVGGPQRTAYTVLGDAVNAAQRLEQLGKDLSAPNSEVTILVGDQTAQQAADEYLFESLGKHEIRGLKSPVIVHRLIGLR